MTGRSYYPDLFMDNSREIPFSNLSYTLDGITMIINQFKKSGNTSSKGSNGFPYRLLKSPSWEKCQLGHQRKANGLSHKYNKTTTGIFVLFLVKSAVENIERRNAIRTTWGNESYVNYLPIRRIFLLGDTQYLKQRVSINEEHSQYKDIVQYNFKDGYSNNTLKTIGGLMWTIKHCSGAKYVLLVDDDHFVSTGLLLKYLMDSKFSTNKYLYLGSVETGIKPRKEWKWYVSVKEYPFDEYPPFVRGGAVVLSMELIKDIQFYIKFTSYIKFDDVFIGILVYSLKVNATHNRNFMTEKCRFFNICIQRIFTSPGYSDPLNLLAAWKWHVKLQQSKRINTYS